MDDGGPRPPWQREPCPAWCVVRHEAGDHPDDRKHVSAAVTVPVVELSGRERVPGPAGAAPVARDVPRAAELVVCVQRRDGAADTWLYAGDGTDQHLELDLAGWARLLPAVAGLLAEVVGRAASR